MTAYEDLQRLVAQNSSLGIVGVMFDLATAAIREARDQERARVINAFSAESKTSVNEIDEMALAGTLSDEAWRLLRTHCGICNGTCDNEREHSMLIEIGLLRAHVKAAADRVAEMYRVIDQRNEWVKDREATIEKLTATIAALREFARHSNMCASDVVDGCNCGLGELLERTKVTW